MSFIDFNHDGDVARVLSLIQDGDEDSVKQGLGRIEGHLEEVRGRQAPVVQLRNERDGHASLSHAIYGVIGRSDDPRTREKALLLFVYLTTMNPLATISDFRVMCQDIADLAIDSPARNPACEMILKLNRQLKSHPAKYPDAINFQSEIYAALVRVADESGSGFVKTAAKRAITTEFGIKGRIKHIAHRAASWLSSSMWTNPAPWPA